MKLLSHHLRASLPRAVLLPRGHLTMFGDMVTSGEAVLVASSGKRAPMLLRIPQHKTYPAQNINGSKTRALSSSVLRQILVEEAILKDLWQGLPPASAISLMVALLSVFMGRDCSRRIYTWKNVGFCHLPRLSLVIIHLGIVKVTTGCVHLSTGSQNEFMYLLGHCVRDTVSNIIYH